MPSDDVSNVVAKLIIDTPDVWAWPVFNARHGFPVVPFSVNCNPATIDFPADKYEHARSFIAAYGRISGPGPRLKFIRLKQDQYTVGREAFKTWARKKYAAWGMAKAVAESMAAQGFEGFEFMRSMRRHTKVSDRVYTRS